MKKKTKIIATVGPACRSHSVLTRMIRSGVDILRINSSHTSRGEMRDWIRHIRKLSRSLRRAIPILVDLQGPRIRTGALKDSHPVRLKAGQTVEIRVDSKPGHGTVLTTLCRQLPVMVKKGDPLLIDNGMLSLKVTGKSKNAVRCRVLSGGTVGENKGINLPRAPMTLQAISDQDLVAIKTAVELKVDFLALSFVRSEKDLGTLREVLRTLGAEIPIIAKIEKPMALERIPLILAMSDGLMVARGDLGIELGVENIPVIQKKLIWMANRNNVFAITATQMLESMMQQPRPLRAEASDVANAVFDGTHMVMLSGETAVGKYPVETVRMMSKIIAQAENFLSLSEYT